MRLTVSQAGDAPPAGADASYSSANEITPSRRRPSRHAVSPASLHRDPRVDLLFEHPFIGSAPDQDLSVEIANVEFRPQRLLGPRAQPEDRRLADLVGERLARNGDVALDPGALVVTR